MSLINDALKKAQRVRNDSPATTPAPAYTAAVASSAAAPVASSYSRPRKSNTAFLIGAGALVLIGLAVGATLFIDRGASAPAVSKGTALAAPTPAPAPVQSPSNAAIAPVERSAPAPVAFTPAPTFSQTPAPAPKPVAVEPAPTPQQTAITPVVTPKVETPVVATVAPPPATPPKPDERALRFVDAMRVAGVRLPGPEGRVLMNDRVFKLNDTVDRSLGLKLTKITANLLTFTDANGVTYEKDF